MQTTLFEPSDDSPLASASNWLESFVPSEMAITFCVIAVALLGFSMLQGRISVRLGARSLIGVFVLLSAPTIAGAFSALGSASPNAVPRAVVVESSTVAAEPRKLPPLGSDPNPSASLRRE